MAFAQARFGFWIRPELLSAQSVSPNRIENSNARRLRVVAGSTDEDENRMMSSNASTAEAAADTVDRSEETTSVRSAPEVAPGRPGRTT